MFTVKPETIEALYSSQDSCSKDKLRLDVSSSVVPQKIKKPYDLEKAQQAVPERFLRTVSGYVDSITVDWDEGHDKEWILFLCIKKNGEVDFPRFLGESLTKVFGLKPKTHHDALDLLGKDFLHGIEHAGDFSNFRITEKNKEKRIEALGIPYDSVKSLLEVSDPQPRKVVKMITNGKWNQ